MVRTKWVSERVEVAKMEVGRSKNVVFGVSVETEVRKTVLGLGYTVL